MQQLQGRRRLGQNQPSWGNFWLAVAIFGGFGAAAIVGIKILDI